jgi:alginate O-acetyltransferase complex protein AlgJ
MKLRRSTFLFVGLAAALLAPSAVPAQDFSSIIKGALAASAPTDLAIQGKGDANWFFLRRELEHLQHGDLAAADLLKANKEGTDPVPVIAKYAAELKALGVDLLVVPVPAKASIYPEKLDAKADAASVPALAPFLAKLKAEGVETLDLEGEFKKVRSAEPANQLYCATDSHWSPSACQLVAGIVAARYKGLPEVTAAKVAGLAVLPAEAREYHGDLLTDAQKGSVAKEKLPLARAGLGGGSSVTTVESSPTSPIVVMGDSHLQVFRKGGNMLDTQGGFVDHLQVGLGTAVQEFTMQAGGADGPRVEIARTTAKNPDFWAKKKVVVWVFTAREFTQGKWRVIPALVKKK